MTLAIVILNWNGKKLLEQFLPSIIKFSQEAEIYIADNASTDNSVNYIKENFPSIKIIQNKINGGYAKGYNDALKHVKADIFCLLNNDVEVSENWLIPIIKVFETEKETAIIQSKILDYKNKEAFEYAGAAGGFIDKYGYPFCRGRIFNTIENDNNQYNDNIEIFWASGACLFIRCNIYKELNGFDELFFAHMEEIDLCWRAKNLGYLVKYVGNSTVYHLGGGTLQSSSPKKTFLNFRNSLFAVTKNAKKNVFEIIMVRLILDGLAAIKFILELKFIHAIVIIKAHLSYYMFLRTILKQRKKITRDVKHYQIRSIVFNYFVMKKTKFKSL